jgi:succinate dehydrogenase/fumarate reductase flavoprotein subunit
MKADVVIAGAGIGGLTAARSAQELGARVLVLEKAPASGGSAAMSGGGLWCAADPEAWRSVQPGGDPALGGALIDHFREGVEWLRRQGVGMEVRVEAMPYRFPRVVYTLQPDARAAMETLAARITEGGGTILTRTRLRDLRLDQRGRIQGVLAQGLESLQEIAAPAVVLATGGFQGSAELRARYFGRWSDRMLVRANAFSTGEGLEAALRAGAATAGPFGRFYGHLVPAPPWRFDLAWVTRVTFYSSERAVFVNLRGERFADEALGDEVTAQDAIHQPEALAFLIFDERLRAADLAASASPGPVIDRVQNIRDGGGEVLEAPRLEDLAAEMASRWGVACAPLNVTLAAYNGAARGGSAASLPVPRTRNLEPLEAPPFYAVRMLPGITITYGGARVDASAQVLDTAGEPIGGLYAAGADAGGIDTLGYTGGLALGLAFGRIAGSGAAAYVAEERSRGYEETGDPPT